MIYMGPCWQCESCLNIVGEKPWKCPACKKEVCNFCFDRYLLCEECFKGKTNKECQELSKIDWNEDEDEGGDITWI